ncbi:E3 ubiquitin-protein ligase RNF144A-like [Arachis ipaensis]|uniref:E3 ubiquitin-protein ligase RNF144A-like n=1 Tax=Arachis ipaensis TaxID=130454 RepID=UPI000A2B8439|nr:E3 ubiquitin-protein ligase RNF144A-like [Arachis ipaensis]QHO22740.1 E3 ubiquitin-protein ligase [Arachis hypogaea]
MEGSSSSSSSSSLSKSFSDVDDSLLLVDDFYFSALFDSEELFPINDEKYAEELHLQEALYSSAISLKRKLKEVHSESSTHQSHHRHHYLRDDQVVLCAICMDSKPSKEIFINQNCNHSFCDECIAKYVAAKIQENISHVKCPEPKCREIMEPQNCMSIIPKEVFERWENALCENLVLATSKKFYCPFKDCSAMLVNDDGSEVVTCSECPNCHRLFCAQCKVPWHGGMECGEFMSLNENEREKEDLMVMNLAKDKRWRRCSKCRFYVEKNQGCSHISCRCGHQFCYACGKPWNQYHGCT